MADINFQDVLDQPNMTIRQFNNDYSHTVMMKEPRVGYLYLQRDPFNNCQVGVIGNMEDVLLLIDTYVYSDGNKQAEDIIKKTVEYLGKRQTMIDVSSVYVNAAKKLFGANNLMWEQTYINGTHNEMCTMMFVNSKFMHCPMQDDEDEYSEDDDEYNDSDDDD